jgi:hypothetical protein
MSKLLTTVVVATLSVLLNAPTPAGLRQNCCEKHAYCCTVKSACCGTDRVSEQVQVAPPAEMNTTAQLNCCIKHAYCCSQHRDCCRNRSNDGKPATETNDTTATDSCCAKHAYCCSVRQSCCSEAKADFGN